MKPELDKQLTQAFPEIFQPRYMMNHRETPLEYFGFECGDGWYQLLYNLCSELMSVPETPPTAVQVKEKYGTLRFYVEDATDDHYKIIEHYEHLSGKTCEVCGEPGKIRPGGWIRTLCEEHNQLRHNT
jgi:hypothetical protein